MTRRGRPARDTLKYPPRFSKVATTEADGSVTWTKTVLGVPLGGDRDDPSTDLEDINCLTFDGKRHRPVEQRLEFNARRHAHERQILSKLGREPSEAEENDIANRCEQLALNEVKKLLDGKGQWLTRKPRSAELVAFEAAKLRNPALSVSSYVQTTDDPNPKALADRLYRAIRKETLVK